MDPWIETEVFEDFIGAYVDGNTLITPAGTWGLTGASGTPTISVRASEAGAPGIVRISTDSGSGDEATLLFAGALEEQARMSEVIGIEGRFRLSHTSNVGLEIGVDEGGFAGTGEAVHCGLSGGNIIGYGRDGVDGTVRTVDSGTELASSTWYRFRLTRGLGGEADESLNQFGLLAANGDLAGGGRFTAGSEGAIDGGATSAPTYFGCRVRTTTTAVRYVELDALRLRLRHAR